VSLSAGALPLLGDDEQLFWLDGQPRPATADGMNWTLWYIVGPGYREAMGIPLLAGRFFRPEDDERAPPVVVIDDVFARQYFGAADPIGKLLHLDGYDRPVQVVGLVGHVVQWGLDSDDKQSLRAQMYFPVMQLPDARLDRATGIDMVVRSSGSQPVPFDAVRAALREMDPDQVAFDPRVMEEVIATSLAGRRFSMLVLVAFGVLALLLASVGIYGVIAYAVGRRTAEIGVRMALGARRADVLRLILAQGLRMAVAGIAIGLAAALALTRLMVRLLYGVSATDPATFAAVAVGLTGVALLASYLPARRAAMVEPMAALRHE
jgi:predicted permease